MGNEVVPVYNQEDKTKQNHLWDFIRILLFYIGFFYYIYRFHINLELILIQAFEFQLKEALNVGIFDIEKQKWAKLDILNEQNIFQLELVPRSYPLNSLSLTVLIQSRYTYQKIPILNYITTIKFPSSEVYNFSILSNNYIINQFTINIKMQKHRSNDSFFDCVNTSNYLRCRISNACVTQDEIFIFGYQQNISIKFPVRINPKSIETNLQIFSDQNSIQKYTLSQLTAIFIDIQTLPVFFHSLTESIFPVSMIINEENLTNKPRLLLLQRSTPTRTDLFKLLNLTVHVIKNNSEKYCFKKIIVGSPQSESNFNPYLFNKNNRKIFREMINNYFVNFSMNNKKEKTNLLLLNRPRSTHRFIMNPEKLLSAINLTFPDWNLTYTDFSGLSMKNQIQLVMNTDILITIHGSGLANMLFLNDNAFIIEIFPYLFGKFYPVFSKLANKTKQNLVMFHASRNSSTPRNEKQRIELENNYDLYNIFIMRQNIRDQFVTLNDTEIQSIINILKIRK